MTAQKPCCAAAPPIDHMMHSKKATFFFFLIVLNIKNVKKLKHCYPPNKSKQKNMIKDVVIQIEIIPFIIV